MVTRPQPSATSRYSAGSQPKPMLFVLGATTATIANDTGSAPVVVKTFQWGGITTGRNSRVVSVPAGGLIGAP